MNDPYVSHKELAAFAADKVNISQDKLTKFRDQVKFLREQLTKKINEAPDFVLIKMLQSGSVAKGTALSTLNDMDMAVYIRSSDTPTLVWLADNLFDIYKGSGMNRNQFQPKTHCVTISFRGSGLDVDVVPVLYNGQANDLGYLTTKDTGEKLLTSIPLHLKFIRDRKAKYPELAQVIRLLKWWICELKKQDADFRFKSFMVELICIHLGDNGQKFTDYENAIRQFLVYILRTGLQERIAFTDYYKASQLPNGRASLIEIFDPVNPQNNVCSRYGRYERDKIVKAAQNALNAINEAHYTPFKTHAINLWKEVMGPSFGVGA